MNDLKFYKVLQNGVRGIDGYDVAVVIAESEEDAIEVALAHNRFYNPPNMKAEEIKIKRGIVVCYGDR